MYFAFIHCITTNATRFFRGKSWWFFPPVRASHFTGTKSLLEQELRLALTAVVVRYALTMLMCATFACTWTQGSPSEIFCCPVSKTDICPVPTGDVIAGPGGFWLLLPVDRSLLEELKALCLFLMLIQLSSRV